ncbi:MAG: hypothetical protein JOZ38_02235 [Candidatus Eremiobacteraeota bacterium]|nr:hypothetical protein [Candidatus Eremiobacteraeota bacterium]
MRVKTSFGLIITALILSACGGGGGGGSSMLPGGGSGDTNGTLSVLQVSEHAITTTNDLGEPLKGIGEYEQSISPFSIARQPQSTTACHNAYQFSSPDLAGDPNSTETQYFYDSACTFLARDVVRKFNNPGGSGNETIYQTATLYAFDNAHPIAIRNDTVSIANGTYNANGFPSLAAGYNRTSTGSLQIAGSKVIDSDFELIMSPESGNTNTFCTDSAGFSATGVPSLGETFGWTGGVSSGTRTNNGGGSVTWSATHTGTGYKGPIGSVAFAFGNPNTSCPITSPLFSLTGGTQTGAFSYPITATYQNGLLIGLTVSGGTLSNGDTLNVTTQPNIPPQTDLLITGTITHGTQPVATFNVNAFGNGTLTPASGGPQLVITDWHVIK